MAEVVALSLPGGPNFIRAVRDVWAAGDAIFPVDPRLPAAELDRVMAAVAPSAVIEADGQRRARTGGKPTEPGDAAVVTTSGTTGEPKGVVLTHDAMQASALATGVALDINPATDTWLGCLPLAHIGGLAVVTRSIITDTPLILQPSFDPDAVAEALEAGATLASFVTRALVQIDPARFRRILLGGAAPPPNRPSNVIATYGLTETGSGCVYERDPLQGVELMFDRDDQLLIRAPMLLRAYRNAMASTLETDPKNSEGWFATGDLGGFDKNGKLFIDGRKSEVIITGGQKVWPSRGEDVLRTQPGVADVALIGQPHPEWGHEVVAMVVPNDDGPDLNQLRAASQAELPVWYAPRRVELVESLPRTAIGKLHRARLTTT